MARVTEVRRLKQKQTPPMAWKNYPREVEENQERFILSFVGICLGLTLLIPFLIRMANWIGGTPVLY